MALSARQVIDWLDLQPLPVEGGHFRQTYASERRIELGPRPSDSRALSTAILYLLTNEPHSFSALHRLPGDEVYHFYLGDPVDLLLLHPDGHAEHVRLGHDLLAGQRVQVVVPAGCWQGSRLAQGGEFALLGTTMAPGFAEADYEAGVAERLTAEYPDEAERIRRLTR